MWAPQVDVDWTDPIHPSVTSKPENAGDARIIREYRSDWSELVLCQRRINCLMCSGSVSETSGRRKSDGTHRAGRR